jgi:hypothetical protein
MITDAYEALNWSDTCLREDFLPSKNKSTSGDINLATALFSMQRKGRLERKSNLFALPFNILEYCLECAVGKVAVLASFLIILIPTAHSLWTEVESIPERLVNAIQNITASHENLGTEISHLQANWKVVNETRPLECRAACSWMRSHKNWLGRHGFGSLNFNLGSRL